MNPISNHQFGQDQHREYEAKYGNNFSGSRGNAESANQLGQHKLALAMSSASLLALVFALAHLV